MTKEINENTGAACAGGGTSTGSAGLDQPAGQFTKGTIPSMTGDTSIKRKTCDTCGFVYSVYSKTTKCPNCVLTRMRSGK